MPQKIRINLSGTPPNNPFQHASGLRALLYGWLQQSSRNVAQTVHDANQAKPFTISPLGREDNRDSGCFFDVSLLADWLSSPVLDGLSDSSQMIRLGREGYVITGWNVVRQANWESLLDCGNRPRDFAFRILTPTAHHTPGIVRKSIVAPSPELYFGSWLNRWNLCCVQAMPDEIADVVAGHLALSSFCGKTEAVRLEKDRTFIGFVGSVRFSVLAAQTLSADAIRYLQALARFADFCGTGVDTSRGMGQTVLSELVSSVPDPPSESRSAAPCSS